MFYLKKYLEFLKENRNIILFIKLFILVIINIWLLIIFWKILLIEDLNLVNNNKILTKSSLLLQPVLSLFGIDMLTPNMLKMLIITFVIIISNLSVLYFNQMIVIISLGILARYTYKSYTNYLINQDNFNYLGFEPQKMVEKAPIIVEKAPIIIEKTVESTHGWGIWIALGVSLLLVIGYVIYSQNGINNSIIETNENIVNLSTNVKNITTHTDEKMTRSIQQINYNNDYTTTLVSNLDKKVNIISEQVVNLENTVQKISEDLTQVAELNNTNVLDLSQKSYQMALESHEAMAEISQATTTVEAVTVGFAKIWDILKEYTQRVEILENKSEIPMNTPRGSMHLRAPNIEKIINKDE